jgi:anti-sigma-K factor RskA
VPPAPAGQAYQAWVRHGDTWRSLGVLQPDAGGGARLIAEAPWLVDLPEAVQVTLEPDGGSATPRGPVMLRWPDG